ncbi:hypothetical protein, partial [Micromonospora sp. NPDC048830]|uniref:hypothetical protein n=1 Tax=Micromonospora sp. NPDC048830 TaxID=3364257 RepID=UPI003711EB15
PGTCGLRSVNHPACRMSAARNLPSSGGRGSQSIRGDMNNGSAKITVDGESETVQLVKGAWRGVGVGEDETKGLATLLEIRLTA